MKQLTILTMGLLTMANCDAADLVATKVLAVTLYRELSSPDFRRDHELMLSVIRNRAERVDAPSLVSVCTKRWQFSYWNRFWLDGKFTLTPSKLEGEYKKVPATFVSGFEDHVMKPSVDPEINHFYSPNAMHPKFSTPVWAVGKTAKHVTKKFRYYAL